MDDIEIIKKIQKGEYPKVENDNSSDNQNILQHGLNTLNEGVDKKNKND